MLFFGRSEKLEKELAVLKEKNHQLDDMLKSQQRKVRHMIEQVRMLYTCASEKTQCKHTHTHTDNTDSRTTRQTSLKLYCIYSIGYTQKIHTKI